MRRIQEAMEAGQVSDIETAAVARVSGPRAATYGEITPKGFATLGMRLGLGPESHFADLGSGCGQAVIQAAEQFGVASACGVELAPSRHAQAVVALQQVSAEVAIRVSFVQADCASDEVWADDGPLHKATDVWLSSLCMSSEFLEIVGRRIAASRTVQRVASLRPVEMEGFRMDGPCEPCEMSWSAGLLVSSSATEWDHPGVPVHVYTRDAQQSES